MSLSQEIRKFSYTGSGTNIIVVDDVPYGKFHHKCNCCERIGNRKIQLWRYRKKSEYRESEYMITDYSDTYIIGKEKMKDLIKEKNIFGCRTFGEKTNPNGGLAVTGTRDSILQICNTANEKNKDKDTLVPLYIGNMDEALYKIGKKYDCDALKFNYCIKKIREQLTSKYSKKYLLASIKKTEKEQYIYLPSGKSRLTEIGDCIFPEDSLHSALRNAFEQTGIDFGIFNPVESFYDFPIEFFFISMPDKKDLEMIEMRDHEDNYHSLFVKDKLM